MAWQHQHGVYPHGGGGYQHHGGTGYQYSGGHNYGTDSRYQGNVYHGGTGGYYKQGGVTVHSGYVSGGGYNKSYSSVSKEDLEKAAAERKRFVHIGQTGLHNLGNTCYANALVQALNAYPGLNRIVMSAGYVPKLTADGTVVLDKDGEPEKVPTKSMRRLQRNIRRRLEKKIREEKKMDDDDKVALSDRSLRRGLHNSTTQRTRELFRMLWLTTKNIRPLPFRKHLRNISADFKGSDQHDSHELLTGWLDRLHDELSTKGKIRIPTLSPEATELIRRRMEASKIYRNQSLPEAERTRAKDEYEEYRLAHPQAELELRAFTSKKDDIARNRHSDIKKYFGGTFQSITCCKECGYVSGTFNAFNVFTVPIPKGHKVALDDCLKEFSEKEVISGDNQWNCERCNKKVDAEKQMLIWEPPEYAIIHLCRFQNTQWSYGAYSNGYQSKIETKVDFPLRDLEFTHNYPDGRDRGAKYNLVATVNQSGSLRFGHYTANVKNFVNGEWYHCDDSSVYHIPKEYEDPPEPAAEKSTRDSGKYKRDSDDPEQHLEDQLHDSTAYILMYKRQRPGDDAVHFSYADWLKAQSDGTDGDAKADDDGSDADADGSDDDADDADGSDADDVDSNGDADSASGETPPAADVDSAEGVSPDADADGSGDDADSDIIFADGKVTDALSHGGEHDADFDKFESPVADSTDPFAGFDDDFKLDTSDLKADEFRFPPNPHAPPRDDDSSSGSATSTPTKKKWDEFGIDEWIGGC